MLGFIIKIRQRLYDKKLGAQFVSDLKQVDDLEAHLPSIITALYVMDNQRAYFRGVLTEEVYLEFEKQFNQILHLLFTQYSDVP